MKILFKPLLVAIFVIVTGTLFAQQFVPGIIAGGVASDIVGSHTGGNFHKVGLTFGGLLNTKISEQNSVQFEVLYTQKGSLQVADSLNNNNFQKIKLNYVEVPLMFRHKFKSDNKSLNNRIYCEAGLSIGILINVSINNGFVVYNQSNTPAGFPLYKKNEEAINLGMGYAIHKNLLLNLRYSNSIVSVEEHSPIQLKGFFWQRYFKGDNEVFSLTLRYLFNLRQ